MTADFRRPLLWSLVPFWNRCTEHSHTMGCEHHPPRGARLASSALCPVCGCVAPMPMAGDWAPAEPLCWECYDWALALDGRLERGL